MEDILLGTTDRTILVFIPDPASTTGAGKTGLNAAALTVTYTRVETDNDVVHSDVTSSLSDLSALTDAHADWGLKEVSSTLSKGLYRLDLADAVFASGAWYAVVQVTITSGTAAATPKAFRLIARNDLTDISQTADNTANITAILADTNELQTDWANGGRLDLLIDATLADTNELQTDWVNGGRLDLILDARSSQTSVDDLPTNAELATALGTADDAVLAAISAVDGKIDTIDTNVDSILADTGTDGVVVAAASKTGYTLSATGSAALTEGYAADGAAFTLNQGLYMIWSLLAERTISGTTLTAAKLDGTTAAMTFTLDDATTPAAQTRAT